MDKKLFHIEISDSYSFDKDEIWVNDPAPENPTVEDVIKEIKESTTKSGFPLDWGFDLQVYVDGKKVDW